MPVDRRVRHGGTFSFDLGVGGHKALEPFQGLLSLHGDIPPFHTGAITLVCRAFKQKRRLAEPISQPEQRLKSRLCVRIQVDVGTPRTLWVLKVFHNLFRSGVVLSRQLQPEPVIIWSDPLGAPDDRMAMAPPVWPQRPDKVSNNYCHKHRRDDEPSSSSSEGAQESEALTRLSKVHAFDLERHAGRDKGDIPDYCGGPTPPW